MDHNHGDMDMGATATGSAIPSATSAASMSMGMGGSSSSCKISMLWNWNTVDSCFIARSWHVTSKGMFAGSCIGVILLGICLELLRRSVKEYDRYLVRQHNAKFLAEGNSAAPASITTTNKVSGDGSSDAGAPVLAPVPTCVQAPAFRPNVFQQAIRALLHVVQFAVAYFLMLLAMYYNGYIIICIFIGAYIGSFIFQWETLTRPGNTSAANEATVCCG